MENKLSRDTKFTVPKQQHTFELNKTTTRAAWKREKKTVDQH